MKKSRVQKLILLLSIIMYSSFAKSQDSTDYTLNNIRKYTTRMDESFPALSNRAGDERKLRLQAAERLKAFSDSIEAEMEYLPDDYYFLLSPLISAYRADIDEYAKLVINDDFEGREKLLSTAFSSLQQRQSSFRRAVLSAYENVVNPSSPENSSPTADKNDTQVATEPQPAGNGNGNMPGSSEVAAPVENGSGNGASKNVILLDTIHTALQQIEQAIYSAERAVQKNEAANIRLATTRIADAALQVSGLSLLLDAKGKENLYMLATSLRHAAENLRSLAKKSTTARSEMENSISEMKIKLGSLSMGIGFIK